MMRRSAKSDASTPSSMPGRFRSIQGRFIRVVASLVFLLSIPLFLIVELSSYYNAVDGLQKRLDVVASLQSRALSNMLWNLEIGPAQLVLSAIVQDADILSVALHDHNGQSLAYVGDKQVGHPAQWVKRERIYFEHDSRKEYIGQLTLYGSDQRLLDEALNHLLRNAAISLMLVVIITLIVQWAYRRTVGKPLLELRMAIESMARGNRNTQVVGQDNDEFGQLITAFQVMQEQVISREQALSDSQQALEAALQQAGQASRAKSTFVTNMSHEMRTPLNAMIGMADILSDTKLSQTQKDYLQVLSRNGDSLLRLINDVLDLATIESGRLSLKRERIALRHLVEEVVQSQIMRAEQRHNSLTYQVAETVPEWVWGDGAKIYQILLNLVGNAIKFTHHGTIFVEMRCEKEGFLTLQVTDSGIGIDPAHHTRIFQPFSQADESTTRNHGGTGLGLGISSHLVALMQGELQLDSQPGSGSRFWCHLYLPQASAPEEVAELSQTQGGRQQGLHILLVEDAEDNQLLIKTYLKNSAHTLTVAYNGAEAVEKYCAGKRFDLILMDMQMPVMDGYEATRQIRSWEERNMRNSIPILALTAHAMEEERQRCLEAGCDKHLSKPIKKKRLLDVLQRYVPV
ncbi:ATP-binding protein [Magnetococcus sp. PR-3]|uniref:ATP-binding protein n=1 Tax=Magnetococcus sp. PR-3 TaxID=3120355 RepID=UPI002FCE35D0